VLVLAGYQVKRERDLRRSFIDRRMEFIVERLAEGFRTNADLESFRQFLDSYVAVTPYMSGIRTVIYDNLWVPQRFTGTPIHLSEDEQHFLADKISAGSGMASGQMILPSQGGETYMYVAKTLETPLPEKKKITVVAAIPNDRILEDYIDTPSERVWYVAIALALLSFLLSYIGVRGFTRNIEILRRFADRSAVDSTFVPGEDFTHDELGDIARRIVEMYRARLDARENLEREHKVAMNAIEEKALAKRQLTNNINHELKTPISVIKGYLDMLADDTLDPDTRRHFIDKARRHADRLVSLISDISTITRLEEGKKLISTERIDMHELAYNFGSEINESATLGDMVFSFEVPLQTYVRGNYNLLMGVLQNLAKNAANYSHGTICRFECAASDDDNYNFVFYDDGVGVAPEHLGYIFERFYRVDSGRARKSGGTGLGLAIVYNTIVAHGGAIKASLRDGGGFQIEFSLPRWS